ALAVAAQAAGARVLPPPPDGGAARPARALTHASWRRNGMPDWMIYGANGYTGRLVAEAAQQRGLAPVLAGRNAAAVEQLGHDLGLPWRAFALDQPQAVRHGLAGIGLVLHCAGPFSQTAAPMLEACL